MVFLLLVVVFPLVLMGLLLGMERVERPLHEDLLSVEIRRLIDSSAVSAPGADDVEALVSRTYGPALERYWRRRRLLRLRRNAAAVARRRRVPPSSDAVA